MAWHAGQTALAVGPAAANDPPRPSSGRAGRPPAFLPNDFEAILPAQWFAGTARSLQPAKRLMLAVLSDAIDLVLQRPAAANTRRAMLQRKAAEWIRSPEDGWLFSFVSVCENLGLEPGRLSAGLARLVERCGRDSRASRR